MYTLLVDIPSLLSVEVVISDYLPDYVVLIEGAGPPLWYLVLYLVFYEVLVRTLRQRSLHRLLMKLVKLVIEASDHVLDLRTFLFGLKSLDDSLLYLLRGNEALIGKHHLSDVLHAQDIVYRHVFVLLK